MHVSWRKGEKMKKKETETEERERERDQEIKKMRERKRGEQDRPSSFHEDSFFVCTLFVLSVCS